MTRAERGVLLLLLGLGVAGQGARLLARPGDPPGAVLLPSQLRPTPVQPQRTASLAAGRPLQPGQRLDPNTASAQELARIPGLGMRLAKEIVADREIRGLFGSLEALDRVEGIGPVTIRRLESFLLIPGRTATSAELVDLNSATQADLDRLPGVGPARAGAILAYRDRNGPFAEPAELEKVPGVSAGLARRLAPLVKVR